MLQRKWLRSYPALLCLSLLWAACSSSASSEPDSGSNVIAPDAASDLARDLGRDSQASDARGDQSAGDSASDVSVGELAERLAATEGVASVVELDPPAPQLRLFEIEMRQPVRHDQPQGTTFLQRLRLAHRDESAPMVLYSTGYAMPTSLELVDVTQVLSGNQLTIEPRFCGDSRPAGLGSDWSALTIAEAAADLHAIVTRLRPIYGAKWLTVGGSKGGMDAVYHRRFYPADVAATVAYVAPNSYGLADDRYPAFLASVGTKACRDAVTAVARELLERADAMIERMKALEVSQSISYAHLGYRKALEHATLEFLFAYWQYRGAGGCGSIPDAATVTDDDLFAYVDAIVWMPFFSDSGIALYEPYFYQAATELGFPAPHEQPVADLLQFPGSYQPDAYLLNGQSTTFDEGAMQDVQSWVSTDGERLLFVYGSQDPYGAAAFDIDGATDSLIYVVDGGLHYVRLDALPQPDKTEAIAALKRWAQP